MEQVPVILPIGLSTPGSFPARCSEPSMTAGEVRSLRGGHTLSFPRRCHQPGYRDRLFAHPAYRVRASRLEILLTTYFHLEDSIANVSHVRFAVAYSRRTHPLFLRITARQCVTTFPLFEQVMTAASVTALCVPDLSMSTCFGPFPPVSTVRLPPAAQSLFCPPSRRLSQFDTAGGPVIYAPVIFTIPLTLGRFVSSMVVHLAMES